MKSSKNKKRIILVVFLSLIISFSFTFGYLVADKHYPPFKLIKKLEDKLLKTHEVYFKINKELLDFDVNSIILIKDETDIIDKRSRLRKFIWGDTGLPLSKMPNDIAEGFNDPRYSDLKNLKTINKLTVLMDHGFESIAYHFLPIEKDKNKLIIYHQGHRGDFIIGKDTIGFFLEKGYSVLAFSMPVEGMNNRPILNLKRFGKLHIQNHRDMQLLDSPIKPFVEPITVSLNYMLEKFNYDLIAMVGISGGGWTTYLIAALDPRISKSYPVAGGYPIYIESLKRYLIDVEHYSVDFLRIANYLELFVLGAYGDGRKQFQIFNQFDPIMSRGILSQTYEKKIISLISSLGKGNFEIFIDNTHRKHKISKRALEIIANDLEVSS